MIQAIRPPDAFIPMRGGLERQVGPTDTQTLQKTPVLTKRVASLLTLLRFTLPQSNRRPKIQ